MTKENAFKLFTLSIFTSNLAKTPCGQDVSWFCKQMPQNWSHRPIIITYPKYHSNSQCRQVSYFWDFDHIWKLFILLLSCKTL